MGEGAAPDARMNGLGFSVRPRPAPSFAVDFGLDFLTFWNGGSSTSMAIRVFAPVLFFPVPHFFIGFGPQFEVIAGGNSAGQWLTGALSEIGGYF